MYNKPIDFNHWAMTTNLTGVPFKLILQHHLNLGKKQTSGCQGKCIFESIIFSFSKKLFPLKKKGHMTVKD